MNGNGKGYKNPGDYADVFDVRGSLQTIGRAVKTYKNIVLLTCALTLGLVTLYIYLFPPIYKAQASLMAERDIDSARDSFYTDWNIFRKDDGQTELELMRGGPVLAEVVKREHLTYDDVYHPFFSQLAYIWKKSPPGRAYTKVKELIFPNKDANLMSKEDQEIGMTIADMQAGISTEAVGETNVGTLEVKGPNASVYKVANTLLKVYMEHRSARHRAEAENSMKVLNDEAKDAEQQWHELAAKRARYAEEHNINFDFQKESLEVGKFADLEATISTETTKAANLEATIAGIDEQLKDEPHNKTSMEVFNMNQQREAAKGRRQELEMTLAANLGRYRDDAPEIKDTREEIAKLDTLINSMPEKIQSSRSVAPNGLREALLQKRAEMSADLKGTRAGLETMKKQREVMQARLNRLPEMETTMKDMDQEMALAQQKYNTLRIKGAEAAVSAATVDAVMPSIRVVEYAMPPGGKYWPKLKILYPSALAVGLILGICLAVLTSYVTGRVNRDYMSRFQGAPLYGHVQVALTGHHITVAGRGVAAGAASAGSSKND